MSIAVREKNVESALVSALDKINLPCLKFDPSNRTGMPDRIVLLPGGKVVWVELKTDNGRLAPIQELRHMELGKIGHDVRVIWNREDVEKFVEEMKEALKL